MEIASVLKEIVSLLFPIVKEMFAGNRMDYNEQSVQQVVTMFAMDS